MPASGARGVAVKSDVLSDARHVRLTSAVSSTSSLSVGGGGAAVTRDCRHGDAERSASSEYHLIARGTCWGHAVGQEPIRLGEGDLIVFPQGDAHVLASAPGMRAAPDMSYYARPSTTLPFVYQLGGGGPERTRVVCGFLGCDERPYNPLLTALPTVIHLSATGPQVTTGWLATLLNIAVKESGSARAGGENVLARISELMFVEAIRRYFETLPPAQTGWPAGLRTPVVGPALAARTAARAAWRLSDWRDSWPLAFGPHGRFTKLVGQPPMHSPRWHAACFAFAARRRQVAAVSGAVGYSRKRRSAARSEAGGSGSAAWRKGTVPRLPAVAPEERLPMSGPLRDGLCEVVSRRPISGLCWPRTAIRRVASSLRRYRPHFYRSFGRCPCLTDMRSWTCDGALRATVADRRSHPVGLGPGKGM